ncbi:MAG: DUF721 domain-containing protein [candidate division Zixibacteria bacterium]|nr:DUF721 domain-containing protein [candidate division Zixibacteria bacterium]
MLRLYINENNRKLTGEKNNKKPGKGFFKLGEILSEQLKRTGLTRKLNEQQAVIKWEEIAGEKLARHTRAVKVHERRLLVIVDSPILRNELTFLKPDLLEKLRSEVPDSGVEDIIFR